MILLSAEKIRDDKLTSGDRSHSDLIGDHKFLLAQLYFGSDNDFILWVLFFVSQILTISVVRISWFVINSIYCLLCQLTSSTLLLFQCNTQKALLVLFPSVSFAQAEINWTHPSNGSSIFRNSRQVKRFSFKMSWEKFTLPWNNNTLRRCKRFEHKTGLLPQIYSFHYKKKETNHADLRSYTKFVSLKLLANWRIISRTNIKGRNCLKLIRWSHWYRVLDNISPLNSKIE